MRLLGLHTYLGTFEHGLHGVMPYVDVIGSVETWAPAIEVRKRLGRDALTFEQGAAQRNVDVVFLNPPCSRFSTQSAQAFDDHQRANIDTFDDLMQGVQLAAQVKARALWWETGPMCWRAGEGMVRQAAKAFAHHSGISDDRVLTLTLRVDALWCGVPQLRPRVHVMHFRDVDAIRWLAAAEAPPVRLPPGALRDYVQGDAPGPTEDPAINHEIVRGIFNKSPHGRKVIEAWDARQQARAHLEYTSFRSNCARVYGDDDPYSFSLNGRPFAWWDQNRWWSVEEYCSLMGAPREWASYLLNLRVKPSIMLAKGVCAGVARQVFTYFVHPTLCAYGEGHRGDVQFDAPSPRLSLAEKRELRDYQLVKGKI